MLRIKDAQKRLVTGRLGWPLRCGWVLASLLLVLGGVTFADAEGEDEVIAWETVSGAQAYDVEVASDAEFRTLVHSERVTSNRLQWKPTAPGVLWLRIATMN